MSLLQGLRALGMARSRLIGRILVALAAPVDGSIAACVAGRRGQWAFNDLKHGCGMAAERMLHGIAGGMPCSSDPSYRD
jgi:hypothetical protein